MTDPSDYDRTEFTAWLTASCERQGVPVTITDPTVITQIATLIGTRTQRDHRSQAARHGVTAC
ncbi:hypothetical protein [Mycobacteroides abscessus]|uniref:hypothetical protein n=1 Tax=Mycobacteroides abscessus TaxID=36809 RepID=UPI000C262EB7|nr:hypothetical protein [Mycobacteroides abscessus]